MYWPLIKYSKGNMYQPSQVLIGGDAEVYEHYYNHIWHTHFDQMQQGMAVLRKPWCDYVVYTPESIYYQRIPYCHNYFIQRLLNPTRQFLNDKLDPNLSNGHRLPLPSSVTNN